VQYTAVYCKKCDGPSLRNLLKSTIQREVTGNEVHTSEHKIKLKDCINICKIYCVCLHELSCKSVNIPSFTQEGQCL